VTAVNSEGIRAWLAFLPRFMVGRDVTFDDCTTEVVWQMAMVAGFRGKARLGSVLVQLRCSACNYERIERWQPGAAGLAGLPGVACAKCGKAMAVEGVDQLEAALGQSQT
jgi:hypothetical protein